MGTVQGKVQQNIHMTDPGVLTPPIYVLKKLSGSNQNDDGGAKAK